MSILTIALLIGCCCALQAMVLGLENMRRYRRAPIDATPSATPTGTTVSVCIPARNEAANIEACVQSALAGALPKSGALEVEVLVYDDQSTDETPTILKRLVAADARVRIVESHPLPDGWNGKQHACWRLANAARGSWLLFTDADVRFAPDALRRSVATAESSGVALLSTVPQQIVKSVGEALLVPLIHFLLLSYLPIGRMRGTLDPAASAGCGQFLLARADAYRATGGHATFPNSMHDGIRMPRLFRSHGFRTDLFDGTDLVACRMYAGLRASWRGFAKNAFEGLGSVTLLVMLTIMHGLGHVLPWAVLLAAPVAYALGERMDLLNVGIALLAVGSIFVSRLAFARRFRQPLWIAAAHPIAVLLMTCVQWHSLFISLTGRREWKGRTQSRGGSGGSGMVGANFAAR